MAWPRKMRDATRADWLLRTVMLSKCSTFMSTGPLVFNKPCRKSLAIYLFCVP
jgi:hypothetical protein